MKPWGGFDHNAQSLRIVTRLERRYAEFDGLNLTWETLEGLVKHNGPLTDAEGRGLDGPVPQSILDYCARTISNSTAMPGWRRRPRRSPTTSPTTRMTSTTDCAPGC
jgi:dGTP triphosphohydrolase